MGLFDLSVKKRNGDDFALDQLKGKVLLIVNTATGCGFTPQYEGLEKLYETYHDQGLEVLDFPCNQFGKQAPGSDAEIHEFCTMRYKTQFDQFKKIENKKIPKYIDYDDVPSLRIEARQKLKKYNPISVGQASRISGVSPADISVLLIYLESYDYGREKNQKREE